VRLDLNTGGVVWKHQPVPFSMDNDPDWAAGPAITWPSCGTIVVSTQKDGWTWAVDETSSTASASVRWAFPPGPWTAGGFTPADGTIHGDTDYKRPGSSWGDIYVGTMGGYDTVSNLTAGYPRLHALNICGSDAQRVRWIKDIPGTSGGPTYALGPPTVAGGMFFVGTTGGHVVAVADPSIQPALGSRCEDPDIPNALCVAGGHALVADPWIKDVTLPGGASDGIFGEPVVVDGHIYVATWAGNVYMLQP
jgi:outer membrane protein assembly factor BamB